MNQSCRPGLGAEIQCRAGRQRKAQGPLRLHLSPMGCKWYAGLWMRAVSERRAGPLLKDEFQPSFLTSWMQTCSDGFRGTEQRCSQKGCGFCSSKGVVYACLCPPAEASTRDLLITRPVNCDL